MPIDRISGATQYFWLESECMFKAVRPTSSRYPLRHDAMQCQCAHALNDQTRKNKTRPLLHSSRESGRASRITSPPTPTTPSHTLCTHRQMQPPARPLLFWYLGSHRLCIAGGTTSISYHFHNTISHVTVAVLRSSRIILARTAFVLFCVVLASLYSAGDGERTSSRLSTKDRPPRSASTR